MTLRDRFEARYPCPECVYYNSELNEYTNSNLTNYSVGCAEMWQLRWEAYQAAMEDAGDNWDRRVMDAMYAFDVAENHGCYLEGKIRDALFAAVPEIAPQPDDE